MSAFLELHIKGGGCALVEVSMIGAVMTRGHDPWKPGTVDQPTLVILRSGDTLEVIEASAGGVVGRMVGAKAAESQLRHELGSGNTASGVVHVDWLKPLDGEPLDAASGQSFRA